MWTWAGRTEAPTQVDHRHLPQTRELRVHRVPTPPSVASRYRVRRVDDSPTQAVQIWHGPPYSKYRNRWMVSKHRLLRHRPRPNTPRTTIAWSVRRKRHLPPEPGRGGVISGRA